MKLTHSHHSVYSMNYHLVLVVAYRKKVMSAPIMERCLQIAADIASGFGAEIVEGNGEPDHIHLLISAKPDFNAMKFVNSLKTVSSRRLKQEFSNIKTQLWKDKFWSSSYFITTAGGAPLEVLKTYIESQGESV